ncbi:phenylacetate--CoA ligase family protein [Gillisia hiemivivida]|uniref:Phenylacetate--CoA ligase n=1 Tax=Gillisia hiemivivida TaxID=291190 RepID=A0A5C6ZTI9_9FLAO|nr:AMP-binding protein [Gillisia hiemivivida]TXD94173.1 phenylacetate--CoA ligase [Gillisia hiemivivida]
MTPIQTSSIEKIARIQWLELQKQLLYLQKNSKFYKQLFKVHAIDVSEIKTEADLKRIPVTTKEDLQQFNEDFLCVPSEDVIDYVTTSGTLGNPVNFLLNEADLERLAINEMQSFKIAGILKGDKVQITTTLDRRFIAGMAYFLGLRKLGAGIIRTGSGLPHLQWDSIERFKPNYLVAVPSFLLKMIEYAVSNGIDYKKSSIKAAICIGEPLRDQNFELNALGRKITELWDIELFSTYASTEMATAFTECEHHTGNHIQPELVYTEVLDEAGNPVKIGEIGELVVTTLQVQTMPLLRFATGDMVSYINEICKCGRNTMRLSPVLGRKKQHIKYKGTSLYPQHIIDVIVEFNTISNFVVIVQKDETEMDLLLVKISNSLSELEQEQLNQHFQTRLHVIPKIEMVSDTEINSLKNPTGSRKPVLFLDLRG